MINILISVNDDYLDKAETMLFSVRKNTDEDITVYILNHRLTEQKLKRTKKYLLKKCNINTKEIDVSHTKLDDMPLCEDAFTIEVYYRVLAQYLLPADLDRVLWLDADIVVQKDISNFYHQDFEGKKLVACVECNYMSGIVLENKLKLGFSKNYEYFNSGVLLLNLEALRNSLTEEQLINKSYEYSSLLRWPDQDLLNLLYSRETKICDWKLFNYQICGNARVPDKELENAYIIHYTTSGKPWKYGHIFASSKYYWRARITQGYLLEAMCKYPISYLYRLRRKILKLLDKEK